MPPYNANPFLDALLQQFAEQQPVAAYYGRYGSQLDGGGDPQLSAFLRSQQGDTYNSYLGELLKQPDLNYTKYLDQNDLTKKYSLLAPQQRGERGAGRVQFATGFRQ